MFKQAMNEASTIFFAMLDSFAHNDLSVTQVGIGAFAFILTIVTIHSFFGQQRTC